jgi:hypothetical protein
MYNILKLTSESIIQPHTNNHINGPLLHYVTELAIISFNIVFAPPYQQNIFKKQIIGILESSNFGNINFNI